MLLPVKILLLLGGSLSAAVEPPAPAADTVTVRFHISGMTCGACPLTARLAIKQLPGVYHATVTLDDSLGVVRYDPARLSPAQIAAHLEKETGFVARVLTDPAATPRKPGRN